MESWTTQSETCATRADTAKLVSRISALQDLVVYCLQLRHIEDLLGQFDGEITLPLSQLYAATTRVERLLRDGKVVDSNTRYYLAAAALDLAQEFDWKLEEAINANLDATLASWVINDRKIVIYLDDILAVKIANVRYSIRQAYHDIKELKEAITVSQVPPSQPKGLATDPHHTPRTTPTLLDKNDETREHGDAAHGTKHLELDTQSFLKWLRNIDFRKAEHLLKLQSMRFDPGYCKLFEYNTDDGQSCYRYFVNIDRDYHTHLGSQYLVQPVFGPRPATQSVLLEMGTSLSDSWTHKAPCQRGGSRVPRVYKHPTYVYELGEVQFRSVT